MPAREDSLLAQDAGSDDDPAPVRAGRRAPRDQFNGPDRVRIGKPRYLYNPVEKVHDGQTFPIEDDDLHLTCYEITGRQATVRTTVSVETQFEQDIYQIKRRTSCFAPRQGRHFQHQQTENRTQCSAHANKADPPMSRSS